MTTEHITPEQARELANELERHCAFKRRPGHSCHCCRSANALRSLADDVEHLRTCDGRFISLSTGTSCPHPAHGEKR